MRVIGQDQIGDVFAVTAKTIIDWQSQGMPIALRGRPGISSEYDSAACIEWYALREVAKVQAETPRDRLARLQSEEIELRLAEKRGTLVPADQVEPLWTAMVMSARAFLRSEVNRLSQLLEHSDGVESKRDLLAETFDDFLTKLSGFSPEEPPPCPDGAADLFTLPR